MEILILKREIKIQRQTLVWDLLFSKTGAKNKKTKQKQKTPRVWSTWTDVSTMSYSLKCFVCDARKKIPCRSVILFADHLRIWGTRDTTLIFTDLRFSDFRKTDAKMKFLLSKWIGTKLTKVKKADQKTQLQEMKSYYRRER